MKLCSQGLLLLVIFAETIKGDLESRYQNCDKPNLVNGKVWVTKKDRIARFKCNRKFQLLGEKYATCLRGQWDTNPTCVKPGCAPLPAFNNGQKIDTYRGAVIKFICNPGYNMIGSPQIYCDGSIWNGSIPQCKSLSRKVPTMCDFESPYICGWTQDPFHIFNWSRQQYQTPSRNIGTGPSFDHTLGRGKGGYYMFIETSSPRIENDTARLFSPVFSPELTVNDPSCFVFWYHMYGATTGILNVYIKPEDNAFDGTLTPKFTKSGNQGDEWFHGIVQLPKMNMAFQVIIEALRGSSYVSDIAIDDVKITNGSECINVVTLVPTTEPPFSNTAPHWTVTSPRTTFTFPRSPPLPPLPPHPSSESFTETDKDTDTSDLLTSPVPTDIHRTLNVTQIPSFNVTLQNPQHQLELYSTTEEPKRIPIPAEPTPLILQPRTAIIKRITESTTIKMTSVPTSNTTAINLTTVQDATIPVTTVTVPKKTTTVPKTTTTTPKTTTVKLTTKLVTIRKPIFIPVQKITTKPTTTQSIKTSQKTSLKPFTKKPLITSATTKYKPSVPIFFPELQTSTISTIETSTQEPIQEKIITFNVKVEPYMTTEKTDVTANSERVIRGKKWIEARRGPIPERKNSLSVSSIAGILVAVILVIISIAIATHFYIKHRCGFRREMKTIKDSKEQDHQQIVCMYPACGSFLTDTGIPKKGTENNDNARDDELEELLNDDKNDEDDDNISSVLLKSEVDQVHLCLLQLLNR